MCRQGIRNRRVQFEVTAAVAFAFKCNWLHFAFSCFSSFPWYFVFFFFYFSIYLVVYLFVYFGARRAYHVVITTFCNVNERARAAVGAVELLIDGRIRRWWQHFRMHPYTVAHAHTHKHTHANTYFNALWICGDVNAMSASIAVNFGEYSWLFSSHCVLRTSTSQMQHCFHQIPSTYVLLLYFVCVSKKVSSRIMEKRKQQLSCNSLQLWRHITSSMRGEHTEESSKKIGKNSPNL